LFNFWLSEKSACRCRIIYTAPAVAITVKIVTVTDIAETPTKVPLVNDTILRTTEKLSSYVTDQAREHFDAQEDQLSLLWALQVHESTENVGKTNFIAYIRFIKNIKCLKL